MPSPKALLVLVVLSAAIALGACGDGSDPTNPNPNPPTASAIDGDYEGIGTFSTGVSIVDLRGSAPPVESDCIGDITIFVDDAAQVVLVGSGTCQLPSSAAQFSLLGDFVDETTFLGTIIFTFGGREHAIQFSGTRTGDLLEGQFQGRTFQTARLVVDWDGGFTATRQ